MLAQQIRSLDGPEGLTLVETEEPETGERVVVDIDAAGVSYPDLLRSRGRYQAVNDIPYVPGSEAAGVVRSAPPGSGLTHGQPVAILTAGGTWQQVVAVDPTEVFPLPATVPTTSAAGILTNFLTGHFALTRRAKAEQGETVLVHGAAGGLGMACLHLGAALGLRTVAVVSNAAKAEAARSAGADVVVAVEGWLDQVREHTGGRGVDIVLDPVGGDRFTDSLRALAPEGRLVVLGFTGGDIPTVKVNRLLLRNITVLGAALAEVLPHDPGYPQRQWAELYPLLASGRLTVPEPTIYDLADAATALGELESRTVVGKIVLRARELAETAVRP